MLNYGHDGRVQESRLSETEISLKIEHWQYHMNAA